MALAFSKAQSKKDMGHGIATLNNLLCKRNRFVDKYAKEQEVKTMQENAGIVNTPHNFCGFRFFKAGLWYFIIGIILGFGVLIHYLVGSKYNTTGDFLSNITLWFGSPLALSTAYLQLGGLGMGLIGAAKS